MDLRYLINRKTPFSAFIAQWLTATLIQSFFRRCLLAHFQMVYFYLVYKPASLDETSLMNTSMNPLQSWISLGTA